MSDEYYTQVSESIRSVLELTTRVDERVAYLIKQQDEVESKLADHIENHRELNTRVSILESQNGEAIKKHVQDLNRNIHEIEMKIRMIEKDSQRNEGRWKIIANFVLNVFLCLLSSFFFPRRKRDVRFALRD